MPDTAVIGKSVTAGDYAVSPSGGAFFLAVRTWPDNPYLPPSLDGLSFQESDKVTAGTLDQEAFWAGAVSIALTKISSLSWEVEGDIPLRTKRGQELLLQADAGRGWVSFISKLLQDFLLTNNGAFVEVVRDGGINSSIIGLIPLDTMRCSRTGDPEIPVAFTDLRGRVHELKNYEILDFVDMPSTRASMLGSGKCAAARAYKSIYKMASMDTYISDKVSGRRPLAVNLINGLNDVQLRSVLQTAQSEADARGAIAFMGAIIATVPGEIAPQVATIPLADFPDNFNRKEEFDIAVLTYANNLGLDPQDVQPLTGQPLGTGAQSQVLAEKAKGKGLAAFRQQFIHAIDEFVLPDLTTFLFVEKDWRDKIQQADFNSKTEAYVADSVDKGIITGSQGLQVLVDENVYDKALLPVDITPDDTLSDVEKPEDAAVIQPQAAPPVAPEIPASEVQVTAPPIGQKEGPPQITVNVPPPIINITTPDIKIPPTVVNVQAAQAPEVNVTTPPVTVEAAQIQVNVPEQKAPDITVNNPPPIISVEAPTVNITNEVQPTPVTIENKTTIKTPNEPIDLKITRDNYGNITGAKVE